VEHSLTIPNVFTNLKIKGAGATKHDRLPLSDDQVVTLETAFSSDATAWALFGPIGADVRHSYLIIDTL